MAEQIPVGLVLAGGQNSRFWPLHEKSLLILGGQTLFARHLAELRAAGVREVVSVGTEENVRRFAEEARKVGGVHHRVVIQPQPLGQGDAILKALDTYPEITSRALLVTQVHDLFSGGLIRQLVAAYMRDPRYSILGAQRVSSYFPGGYFVLTGERVTGLIEKPAEGQEPSDLVSVVVRLHRDVSRLRVLIMEAYAEGGPDDHYERAIARQMLEHEHRTFIHTGTWAALKYPWHVLDAVDLFLRELLDARISEAAHVHPTAVVSGRVTIEPGARILAGAAVVGPAYIGRNAIVGNQALVRESVIEGGSVVGFASEVARSYVGPGCSFHTNYAGDSVIGAGSHFGAGSVTANLRLDHRAVSSRIKGERLSSGRQKLGLVCGEGVSLGVQVATMPGVKIGEGAVIGPGVILSRDVDDYTQVMVAQDLRTSPLERRSE